ncbi:MAG: hypothetical protein ACC660_06995, partial [Acidimicrobiales bacterium]
MKKLLVAITSIVLLTALATPPALAQEDEKDEVKLEKTEIRKVENRKDKKRGGVEVRTRETSAVTIGDTAWLNVSIRGKGDVEDLRFTAELDVDGSVGYPANTVDHSGPYNGYELDRGETDYVAFNVTISDEVRRSRAKMTLVATWTQGGESFSKKYSVRIPLVRF